MRWQWNYTNQINDDVEIVLGVVVTTFKYNSLDIILKVDWNFSNLYKIIKNWTHKNKIFYLLFYNIDTSYK